MAEPVTEQHVAMYGWSRSLYNVVGSLTEHGPRLRLIVEKVVRELRSRLFGGPFLKKDAMVVEVDLTAKGDADAVAVGTAYGILVPEMRRREQDLMYPQKNVSLRLGFPIAIASNLPLRSGATIKISGLNQVSFPWLNA